MRGLFIGTGMSNNKLGYNGSDRHNKNWDEWKNEFGNNGNKKSFWKKAWEKALKVLLSAYIGVFSLLSSCTSFYQRIKVESPVFSPYSVAEASQTDNLTSNSNQQYINTNETLTGIQRVYGKDTRTGYSYQGISLTSFDKERLAQFSLLFVSSRQHLVETEENPIKTPEIPDYLVDDESTKMLKELIENKEIARIERETKRREFLISPGVYLNVFSISYPNDLKEKFRLRLSLMPGIQYTYIWRFDTTKYVAYTKDFMTGEERNAGRVNIPFTGSDEDDRIEICFKIQGNISIIDLYMNNCIAPRPSGLFRYNPVHTLFVGIGITF